ncbi:MAG TPA: hypothetical protein VGC62_17040 [Pseudomonas sp.]
MVTTFRAEDGWRWWRVGAADYAAAQEKHLLDLTISQFFFNPNI